MSNHAHWGQNSRPQTGAIAARARLWPVLAGMLLASSLPLGLAAGGEAGSGSVSSPSVDALLLQLKQPAADEKVQAIRALGRLGDVRAYHPILATLEARPSPEVKNAGLAALEKLAYTPTFLLSVVRDASASSNARAFAVYTLGQMQSAEAVPDLITLLQSPDETLRERTIEALGKIRDPRAWRPLILQANKDPNPELRKKAQRTVEQVSALGGERGLDTESLLLQLKDTDVLKRREAAQALADRKSWYAVKPLIGALDDPDSEVRRYAARSLGDLQDRRAVEPLLKHIPMARGLERYTLIAAVAVLRDESSVEPLLPFLKDPDPETRRHTMRALTTLGEKRAGPSLVAGLKDLIAENRREAAKAVGRLAYSGAIPALTQMIKDDVEDNQIEATRSLGLIGGRDALSPLLRVLTHPNPMIVVAAVIAVKNCGLEEGLAPLEQVARRHKEPLVREEALQAHTELRGKLIRSAAPAPEE